MPYLDFYDLLVEVNNGTIYDKLLELMMTIKKCPRMDALIDLENSLEQLYELS